jgi:LAO/AO transport system kinase
VGLVEAVLSGDRRAMARLITRIENDAAGVRAELAQLYAHTGRAHIVGITGAPGAGKSTLVNELAKAYRADSRRVGVLAVDPTSPFSGGAVLGDRIRMRDLSGDSGVFIRSMATRGSLGGLARATASAIKVLDAAGFDLVMVETVGAGQSEVEIAQTAHTVVVVEAAGMGDDVQAIKAGLLEIADVFAVNKADRPGADHTIAALEMLLDLSHAVPSWAEERPSRLLEIIRGHHKSFPAARQAESYLSENPDSSVPPQPEGQSISGSGPGGKAFGEVAQKTGTPPWRPPVIKTIAARGDGILDLVRAIADHRRYLEATGEMARRTQVHLVNELERILRDGLMDRLLSQIDQASLASLMAQVATRELDPYAAAYQLLAGSQ